MGSQYLKIQNGRAVAPDAYDPNNIAHRRRLDHQRAILNLGLSPDVLSDIVDEFYLRVRAHPMLASTFEKKLGENWDHHLDKMKAFWISVALNAGTYSGKPVVAHTALQGVQPVYFVMWLELFKQTILDITNSQEACDFLMNRAEKMANTFKKAMFGDASVEQMGDSDSPMTSSEVELSPRQEQEQKRC